MVAAQKIPNPKSLTESKSDGETKSTDIIFNTHTPELVIALCGPIGSPLHQVSDKVCEVLKHKYQYTKCNKIRLSEKIKEFSEKVKIKISEESEYKKTETLINAGNELRKRYGNAFLAELAVHDIRVSRTPEDKIEESEEDAFKPRRVCHIIDSIKNQEELDLLRAVYGRMLYVIGVFSPLENRVESLQRSGLDSIGIYKLIDRDSGEEFESGQTVRDTFPNSDYFIRVDKGTNSQLENKVNRFLDLILGSRVMTPTKHETAMYAAASASANSACLSRQVGAAATDSEGNILSTGWNDVPKMGGDLYMDEDDIDVDRRCWNYKEKCFNDEEKSIIANELLSELKDVIDDKNIEKAKTKIFSFGKLKGLIEFSRAVHAEMHAIIRAGKDNGRKLNGGKLFITTYPCHSCARHIIAAGIHEVYYIEPYRKSLAIKLHGDAITETETETQKVRILTYEGVSPNRFLDLYRVKSNERKYKGKLIKISPDSAMPKLHKSMEALYKLEAVVITALIKNEVIEQGDGP